VTSKFASGFVCYRQATVCNRFWRSCGNIPALKTCRKHVDFVFDKIDP